MKSTITSIIILLLSANLLAQPRMGVPAVPHPVEFKQPNGKSVTIRIFGDERKSWRTTSDGYVVKENKKGYLCYAKINKKGHIVASNIKAKNPEKRGKFQSRFLKKMKKNKQLYKPRP